MVDLIDPIKWFISEFDVILLVISGLDIIRVESLSTSRIENFETIIKDSESVEHNLKQIQTSNWAMSRSSIGEWTPQSDTKGFGELFDYY